jgi:transcription termination/antitermination protein NusA
MNGHELLRVVDAIHRDKNIDKEIVFEGIEQAILSAARKHFGEEEQLEVHIERESGNPSLTKDGLELDRDVLGDLLGRVAAQTAKQVMIQKIREAERDALYQEYTDMQGQIVTGTIGTCVGGTASINLGKVEGILPRSEQIPGESYRPGERVRAIIVDVRKLGSRVKIILSRTHADLVRRLFEIEIPEISERVIEIRSLAREAGYRSKVAVSCNDLKVDCVGACVGVRGARIKNIVDELAGERIDIVRWNDSLQVLVPNALQPAEVEEVILCPMLGRVIVLVRDDQLSLAIGRRGQNVRLASKLVGWDIEIMTREELGEQLESSVAAFAEIPESSDELAENLVAQGFFSFDDLSIIEPDSLAELGNLTPEQCDIIVAYADAESARLEAQSQADRQNPEERRARERAAAAAAAVEEGGAEASEVNGAEPHAEGDAAEDDTTAPANELEADAEDEAPPADQNGHESRLHAAELDVAAVDVVAEETGSNHLEGESVEEKGEEGTPENATV